VDSSKDYYRVLSVTADADPVVVRAAYRALSQQHHPDKVPLAQREEANRRMAEINEAIAVLGDSEARDAYDDARRGSCQAEAAPETLDPPLTANQSHTAVYWLVFGGAAALTLWLAVSVGIEKAPWWRRVFGDAYVIHWSIILLIGGFGLAAARRLASAAVKALGGKR
jgi:curved DNA-binding protein CbpA